MFAIFFTAAVMERIDIPTRILLVRLYYENASSAAAALRSYKTMHHLRADPFSVNSIQHLLKKFENKGTVLDLPKSGRPSTSDDVVEEVQRVLEQGQSSSHLQIFSARAISRESGLPKTTVLCALKTRLRMHPYRVHVLQELKDSDFQAARVDFANWFLNKSDEDGFEDRVLWTDEAHFYLDGSLCNRNCVIWSTENPHAVATTSLHPQRVTVWCGFSTRFILPPMFLEEGETVTAERYLTILRDHMLPNIPRRQKVIFMQDGAAPHVAKSVKQFLLNHFGADIISRDFPNAWPPRSPDLNPCDFFLWGSPEEPCFPSQSQNTRGTEECHQVGNLPH